MCLQYNTKDSSVRLAYEAQPRPRAIATLAGETITKVACGTNHTGYIAFSLSLSHQLVFCCFITDIFLFGAQLLQIQMAMFTRKDSLTKFCGST